MKRVKLLFGLFSMLFLLGFTSQAMAQEENDSPRNWTAHLAFGAYKLGEIDSNAAGSPFADAFGNKNRLMFQLGLERYVYKGWGTVGIEAAMGYWQTYGKGIYETGEKSEDATVFNMIPLKLSAVYRFDYFWNTWDVPLVPHVKFGFDYYIWWILDQDSSVASYKNVNGKSKDGYGGTFGFHVAYGLMICLDFIDPKLANEFDQDVGVNNTYLYVEGTYAMVNDFGSDSSFDLTDHNVLAGILFEF